MLKFLSDYAGILIFIGYFVGLSIAGYFLALRPLRRAHKKSKQLNKD